MPSEFSLYSARSAVNLRIVFAPLEEVGANRPLAGTGERHITSRRAITECDSLPEIISIREVYIKECTWRRRLGANVLGLALRRSSQTVPSLKLEMSCSLVIDRVKLLIVEANRRLDLLSAILSLIPQ